MAESHSRPCHCVNDARGGRLPETSRQSERIAAVIASSTTFFLQGKPSAQKRIQHEFDDAVAPSDVDRPEVLPGHVRERVAADRTAHTLCVAADAVRHMARRADDVRGAVKSLRDAAACSVTTEPQSNRNATGERRDAGKLPSVEQRAPECVVQPAAAAREQRIPG